MIEKVLSKSDDGYGYNVILNYVFRLAGIFFGLICVRITLGYLGVNLYALWVTITSVISWMNSGDLGIGNGLRNELAKAYGEGDTLKQKLLIKTAIGCLTKVAAVVFCIIIILCEIFFKLEILDEAVRMPMYIMAVFFCINLVLGVSQSVAFSYQKSWLNSMTSCAIQLFSIIMIFILQVLEVNEDLTLFAVVNGLCTTIPNIILILILKSRDIKIFELNKIEKGSGYARGLIMNTGIKFFGMQLCGVVIYSTDNLIINKLFNGEMVTKYSIITKVYDTGTGLFGVLLVVLWSAVTYHIAQHDYNWVKNKVRQLSVIGCIFAVGVLFVSVFFNQIARIWIGQGVMHYETELIALFGIYCVMSAFSAIYANVLNGMGIVKLQLILVFVEAVLNIPLSILFAKYCNMGIFGVKLATFLCTAVSSVAVTVQAVIVLTSLSKSPAS